MSDYEKIIINLSEENNDIDKNFRLFITSFPCNTFPSYILQNSIKITVEHPSNGMVWYGMVW
jgi:dynein heavy chain